MDEASVPLIDISRLVAGEDDMVAAAAIDEACRTVGFFRIVGHGVPADLQPRMDGLARDFFERPEEEKALISMANGGSAWRGWFPVGGELTSGMPDNKEGLYVGTELAVDDPRVESGLPLHGPNLFPAEPVDLGQTILEWLDAVTPLAHAVMRGVALGLGLDGDWFAENLTADPTILFRIFHYPPGSEADWGVAEHTDYGILTLLAQDDRGGLQVHSQGSWIEVPADPSVFVCNIGDMLERLTEGRYRSTPHRVRNLSGDERLSFPFFFDPSWDAEVVAPPLADEAARDGEARRRWDGADVAAWEGPYGDYLTAKVAKVFPELFGTELLRSVADPVV